MPTDWSETSDYRKLTYGEEESYLEAAPALLILIYALPILAFPLFMLATSLIGLSDVVS